MLEEMGEATLRDIELDEKGCFFSFIEFVHGLDARNLYLYFCVNFFVEINRDRRRVISVFLIGSNNSESI